MPPTCTRTHHYAVSVSVSVLPADTETSEAKVTTQPVAVAASVQGTVVLPITAVQAEALIASTSVNRVCVPYVTTKLDVPAVKLSFTVCVYWPQLTPVI
jgi:hypothetical protein